MHIVILSARPGWHTDELSRALAERGHVAAVLPYEGLVARLGPGGHRAELSSEQVPILDADGVLARIIPNGSLEQIIYRLDVLHWIERRGIRVMNSPTAIERCVDKFYTSALLNEAGLSTPETVVCEKMEDALAAVGAYGDAVIKPLFGSMGHGMVRVSDEDTAFRVVRALEQLRVVYYVQRMIPNDASDIRVFVLAGKVLAAIERRATPGEWRANVARGGSVRPITLPPDLEQVALTASAAVGAEYAGVDLIVSRDGEVFVLEVNGIPGWQGLQNATGLDVAGAIVEHLIDRVAAHAEQAT